LKSQRGWQKIVTDGIILSIYEYLQDISEVKEETMEEGFSEEGKIDNYTLELKVYTHLAIAREVMGA
jgi:hypothetical protein